MESINLPVKPIPFDDESAASLLIRSAQANGHESVQSIFGPVWSRKQKTVEHGDLHNIPRFNELIKQLGFNISHNLVYPKNLPTNFSDIIIHGVKYPPTFFRKDGTAHCPVCIKEYGYLKNIWRFIPYSVCHIHKMEILTVCAKCSTKLNPFRGKINFCKNCDGELSPSHTLDNKKSQFLFENHIFKSQKDADRYIEVWRFIEKFTNEANTVLTPHQSNEIIYGIFSDDGMAAELLSSYLPQRACIKNPSELLNWLQLQFNLPQRFSATLLNELRKRKKNEADVFEQVSISKKQAAELLNISCKRLNNYIEQKLIEWPTAVSREAKAPLDILTKAQAIVDQNAKRIGQQKNPLPTEFMDLSQAGAELMIHTEYVRSLCKRNWLKSTNICLDGHRKTVILKKDIMEFNERYILVGTLAKELGVNSTNLAEKLKSIGILPVGGPSIDGLVTSLFRRNDLTQVRTELIKSIKNYPTETGRKSLGIENARVEVRDYLTIPETSKVINLSERKVSVLVRENILNRANSVSSEVRISLSSVQLLQDQLNRKDLMPLKEAYTFLGCTKEWFSANIERKKLADIYNFEYWRLVSRADILAIKNMRSRGFTAHEGSFFLGRHRTHLNNLKKQGIIKPIHLEKDTLGSLDFYAKEDVINLKLKERQKIGEFENNHLRTN